MSAFILSSLERRNRALTLGIVAGLRSLTPIAMLAFRRSSAPTARWASWFPFNSGPGRTVALLAGAGELVGDKLPQTPSRIDPLPLSGRIVLGGFAGAAVASESSESDAVRKGAIIGALGGAVGSFAGYFLRRQIVKRTGLPDLPVAITEDLIAIALAAHATRRD